MRWYRWRVVARDVNGVEIDELARSRFEMRARAEAATRRADVWEPMPGRPMYTVTTEQITAAGLLESEET